MPTNYCTTCGVEIHSEDLYCEDCSVWINLDSLEDEDWWDDEDWDEDDDPFTFMPDDWGS